MTRLPYRRPIVVSIRRPPTDGELARACSDGDRAAWAELCRRHRGLIVSAVCRARPRGSVEDAVQEVLLRVPGLLRGFREDRGELAPYLATAVRRVAAGLDTAEGTGGHFELLRASLEELEDPAHERTPERIVAALEQVRLASRAAEDLPPSLHRFWRLRALEGKTDAEIAAELGTSRRYVRNLAGRAWERFDELCAGLDLPERVRSQGPACAA